MKTKTQLILCESRYRISLVFLSSLSPALPFLSGFVTTLASEKASANRPTLWGIFHLEKEDERSTILMTIKATRN